MLHPEKTCLLIADILGYTEYLSGVEIDHAQDILADLISTVVTALGPHFRLEKLEGDAAFCSAPADTVDGTGRSVTLVTCVQTHGRLFGSRAFLSGETDEVLVELEPDGVKAVDPR